MSKEDYPGLRTDTWVVTNSQLVKGCLERVTGKYAGVDSETTGLDPLMPPVRTRLIQLSNGINTVLFDLDCLGVRAKTAIARWLEDRNRVKIIHNGKFDLKFLIHDLSVGDVGPLFDTLIASQLLTLGDRTIRHKLEAVAQRMGIEVDKEYQRSDWSGPLSIGQLIYASNDASVLLPIRERQVAECKKNGLVKAFQLEFEAVQPTAQMELNGMLLDRKKWMRLLKDSQERCQEVEEQLFQHLKPRAGDTLPMFEGIGVFNLNSNDELKLRLKEIGVKLPTVLDDETGLEKDTTLLDKMAQIADTHPVIKLVIEHRILRKRITSYGLKFLRHINPYDGRAHPDFKQIGTVTGRYTAKEPPLHGIPKRSDHRECLVAPEGYKLVWGDYSQIELRILAELCKDENVLEAFASGKDFHEHTASQVFGVRMDLVQDVQRRRAKDLNFGEVYGVGDKRFGERAGIGQDEVKRIRAAYAKAYPQQNKYLTNVAQNAVVQGYCRTMSGKIIWFQVNRNDKQQVAAVGRHGKNYPIQGSSADITKRAMRLVHDAIQGKDILLVHCAHDELVLQVRDDLVHEATVLLKTCMVQAGEEYLKIVKVVVDTQFNQFWAKVKED